MTDLYDYHNGPNLGLEPTTPGQVTYQNSWLVPAGWKLVPEELIDFLDAKEHHLPVEDRHVLSIMLKAAPVVAQASRACTCHPDDRPDGPCRERYAASECQALAAQAKPSDGKTPSNSAITADEQREFLYLLKKAVRAARALRAAMAKISWELARYGKSNAVRKEGRSDE